MLIHEGPLTWRIHHRKVVGTQIYPLPPILLPPSLPPSSFPIFPKPPPTHPPTHPPQSPHIYMPPYLLSPLPSPELHALLLTDVLVLLEKHEDKDKYYLRTHTVEGVSGNKEELSTVIRLKDCLLRTAAADRGTSSPSYLTSPPLPPSLPIDNPHGVCMCVILSRWSYFLIGQQ